MGKQRNVKKGEKMGKMDLSICIFVVYFLFFRFVFFAFVLLLLLLLFLGFLPGKNKIKAKKTNTTQIEKKTKTNGQVHFFPIFSPFVFPFFPLVFPFYFAFVFFGFC